MFKEVKNMFSVSSQYNMYGNSDSQAANEKEEDYSNYMYDGYIPTILTVDALGLRDGGSQYNIHNTDTADDNAATGDIENEEAEGGRIENSIEPESTLETRQSNLPSVINDIRKTEGLNEADKAPKTHGGILGMIKRRYIGATITEHFVNDLAITGEVVFSSEEITALKEGDAIHFINADYIARFE